MKSRHVAFLAMAAVALALLFFSLRSKAADATLTWTHPTQYTDGSAIGAGALTQTAVNYGKCNGTQTGLLASPTPVTVLVPYPAVTRTITGLGAGTWCFAARSDTASAQSAFTAYVSKVIVLTPQPPSGLTVAVETAFMAVRQDDKYVMIPVGTVPGGTACDTDNGVLASGRAYYAVPSASVQWYGATKATVALAACS